MTSLAEVKGKMDEEGKERAREEHVRRMLSVVPSLSADKKHNSIEVILSCLALRRDHFFFFWRGCWSTFVWSLLICMIIEGSRQSCAQFEASEEGFVQRLMLMDLMATDAPRHAQTTHSLSTLQQQKTNNNINRVSYRFI